MKPRPKQAVNKDSSLGRVLAQRTGNWLIAAIDDHLESDQESRYDPGWFHPSGIGSPCDAMLAFQYMGMTGKSFTKARSKKIMDNGTSRHMDISRYLVEIGISLMKHWGGSPEELAAAKAERSFEVPSLHLRGEVDDIIFNPTTKETYIFEFKTINMKDWGELIAPKPDHITQIQCYMFGRGVLQAQIVYECKNCQTWKTYVVKFDPDMWRSIEARLKNIVQLIEGKQLPWRTPMQNDSQCQFYHFCGGFTFDGEASKEASAKQDSRTR
jgi:hypothetical protein